VFVVHVLPELLKNLKIQ
jgi:hypothetical protein